MKKRKLVRRKKKGFNFLNLFRGAFLVIGVACFLFSVFFFGENLTGYAVAETASRNGFFGSFFFLFGILGIALFLKYKKE